MSPPLVIVAAIVLASLALAGLLRLRAVRARRGLTPPVTEADARAHAMPLTRSVLSVGPSAPGGGAGMYRRLPRSNYRRPRPSPLAAVTSPFT